MKLIKLQRREEIAWEIEQLEHEIEVLRCEAALLKRDEEWRNDHRFTLRALSHKLRKHGSGPEKRLIESVLNGEFINKDQKERLNLLAMQFLQVVL